jgi:molybdenum cofactor biosynthesis enzyme MoaA
VLSGGEPRTNPDLGSIIRYYSGLVDDVVIITNGYTLNQEAVAELTEVGATGITISIDSMSPEESVLTRQTPKRLHAQILENVRRISGMPRKFELGINSVVSHPTAKWSTVKGLLEFGLDIGADFVKFQPVFDDGYVTLTSPDLLLTREDAEGLVQISGLLETIPHPMTNPPGFWKDVASLAKGKSLESAWCGLGNRHSIVTTGELKVCYWVKESSFGRSIGALRAEQALTLRKEFESIKLKCEVGYQCFCTQNLTHMWVPRDG